ncbi:MAG TPA: translocation/assembly module TamB domain-containing protein, partial [Chthoniobacterales bacterium]
VALSETGRSLNGKVRLIAANISLDAVRSYLGRPPEFLAGEAERVAIEGNGAIDAPRTWSGKIEAQINNLRQGNFLFDRCVLNLSAHDGVATLSSGKATKDLNKLELKGTAELPEQISGFGRSPATFEVSASLPDLRSITAAFPKPLSGAATINGRGQIKDAVLSTDLHFKGGPIGFENGMLGQFTGALTASKNMARADLPYYAGSQSQLHIELADLRWNENLIDSVQAETRSDGAAIKVERFAVLRKQNQLLVTGEYRLPDDFALARTQPGKFEVSLGAPDLADYWKDDSQNKISGPLQVSGQVAVRNGKAEGQVSLYGSNLRARDLTVPQFSAQATISNNVIYLNDLTANLNESDRFGGNGSLSLEKPYRYNGKIAANIADLGRLKPLLLAGGNKNEIAGSLAIDWQGSGDAADFKNSGQLKVTLEKGRYANLQALQANIDANYSPEGLNVPTIFFGSDKMDFQAILQAKDSKLEITKIQIDQGTSKYAAGYVAVPFVWENLGTARPLFPPDGKVLATFQSENLDLKRLFEDVGAKPLATGLISVKLDAQGTLAALGARLDVQMRNLQSEDFPKLEPAAVDLAAELQNNHLSLNGKLEQAKIQPVQMTANLPFDLSKIISERKFDEETALSGKIQLPRSSVNFLRQFVPILTQLDGDLALDVNVNGTIAKPVFSGAGDITINIARFSNATLPALSGFQSRLTFDGNIVNLERFGGDLAGGPFTVFGRVTFAKLTEPNLDFQLKAQSVLVARNDSLTARADADVKVSGPLKSATVTGNVALTNSRFLKNLDLIPIGLPGRPAPQPPSDRPDFSIPQPPIRDWKFDVAIKTKDPFLVRGNLANGGAIVDLHLTGTGLHPELQGLVRLDNLEATLPFSRLEIASGFLYFDPGDSFNPKIDLHGTSLIRDYTVQVYVYGTTLSPEAIFTSEPPLPQEEIISLLATGTTREELLGNNNVLAGRAAMLLVQQLYRKVFKKGEATKSNSVFDRL